MLDVQPTEQLLMHKSLLMLAICLLGCCLAILPEDMTAVSHLNRLCLRDKYFPQVTFSDPAPDACVHMTFLG